jgi:hypothetical protein
MDVEHLAARNELGTLNFEEGREVFGQAKELAQEWRGHPLRLAPPKTIAALKNTFESLRQSMDQIAEYSLSLANP